MARINKTKIISNRRVAPDHFLVELDAPYLARHAEPGQFVNVKVRSGEGGPLLRLPLGIHNIKKNRVSFLYKTVGTKTKLLSAKAKGETLDVLGPLGNSFDTSRAKSGAGRKALLVAGGHGVAPLFALARKLRLEKKEVELFLGACDARHLLCVKEFKQLGIKARVATECGRAGARGYVTRVLSEYLAGNAEKAENFMIYACGPKPMLAAVSAEAEKYGLSAEVSLDAYMACGIGVCLGCAVRTVHGYKLVCKDGPVFDAREIDWKSER
ncbi:MAG: dihydroorotate dehydrogenase electron transfer subunit [Candidatus Omnitrophota bacterium]